jgi:peptide/nickel transport system substrate-binding protein
MAVLCARRFAAVAIAALLVPACTKVQLSGRPPTSAPGILRIATGQFDNLNTVLSGGGSSTYLSYLWGAYLFIADDKNEMHPELATVIPTVDNGGISRDGLTITYHLRHGVRWQDGAPFGADDVVFTWHVIMDPKNNVVTRLGYDQVASMVAVDPYTVRVTLKRPFSPAVASLFGPGEVPMPILPRHVLGSLPDINHAAFNDKPVGTGPFIVQSYDPSVGVTLVANPHYWRGAPKLRGIDFLIVTDANTQSIMLRSGELDAARVLGEHAVELSKIPAIRIIHQPAPEDLYLALNASHPPLDDLRVRRAIAMAVDRNFFVRAFQYGWGEVAQTDQPPFSPWYDPHVTQTPYDLAAAQASLDSAGWRKDPSGYRSKDGKRLALTFAYITAREPDSKFAPYFADAMKAIGIELTLHPYPYNLYYAEKSGGGILQGGKYDVAITGWVLGSDPDDSTLWMCDQRPPQGYNTSFFCDPRIDAAEREALSSYAFAARRAAYWKIQKLLDQDVPAVFLSWVDNSFAVRDSVEDFNPGENFWGSWLWQKR